MEHKEWMQACLAKAAEQYDEAEVYYAKSQGNSWTLSQGEPEEAKVAESVGVELVVRQGDQWAQAYTEKIDQEAMEYLLQQVKEALEVMPANPDRRLYRPENGATESTVKAQQNPQGPDHQAISGVEVLDLLQAMTKETRALTDEIKEVQASFEYQGAESQCTNTLGLDCTQKGSMGVAVLYVVLTQGEKMQGDWAYRFVHGPEEVDPAVLAKEAVDRAQSYFGASPIPSGDMPIVLDQNTWASFLSAALYGPLSAEAVQKGMSLLAGKQGEKIASELVCLYDDPANSHNPIPKAFDGEGVPTRKLPLVEGGILLAYLHNLETAQKMPGAKPGNAERGYKTPSHPAVSFMTMEPGELDQEGLLAKAGKGLLITRMDGLHAGINTISGDFSLQAKGFLIDQGKKGRPVDQITIAGNVFELLQKVEAVGSDLLLTMTGAYMPSVLIGSLAVAGK